jgi:coenzyme F420 biosynthesis associated uncharacterized protein
MSASPAESGPFINWELAVTTARRLMRPGPHATLDEIARVVADLREYAGQATPLVRECTGLTAEVAPAPVLIVDRPSWVQANVDAFSEVLAPLFERLAAKRDAGASQLATKVGSRVTGVELGVVLAFLSGKVLGQFDPYHRTESGERGRLLLIAPNIVAVERELRVEPRDFRLWVCLHEETHRVQFTAVDWLEDHLRGMLADLLGSEDLDPTVLLGRLRDGLERAVRAVRGTDGEADRPEGVLDLISTPEQRAKLERITAAMTLLEGHADVVMDLAAPKVIGTLDAIRSKFDARRAAGSSPLDLVLRKLLGLDAKMRQYREGASFVRAVVDRIGMDGFNHVWTSPQTLPTRAEIIHPDAWLERVAGVSA